MRLSVVSAVTAINMLIMITPAYCFTLACLHYSTCLSNGHQPYRHPASRHLAMHVSGPRCFYTIDGKASARIDYTPAASRASFKPRTVLRCYGYCILGPPVMTSHLAAVVSLSLSLCSVRLDPCRGCLTGKPSASHNMNMLCCSNLSS